jgi:o-succinylbenzoate synthase
MIQPSKMQRFNLKATFTKHLLEFKVPSGTSRGVLRTKETWFLILSENTKLGIGECGMLRGLSIDDRPDYEEKLQWVCTNIALGKDALCNALVEFPSIQIGVEMAFMSLASVDGFDIFPSQFSSGEKSIPINGLIWMGSKGYMKEQIAEKMDRGFKCIKMKIGAIDFQSEIAVLRSIRKQYSASDIEIRVDANGAFSAPEALEKLKWLSELDLHSIEQPIKQGQWQEMARLCEDTPLDIALDEELIGVFSEKKKVALLDTIKPQYIILKPSFIGGFKGTDAYISLAEKQGVHWWVTSALESNVGLNAISQYTFTKNSKLPQGLGTGSLYANNIPSPLEVIEGSIFYTQKNKWNLSRIKQ